MEKQNPSNCKVVIGSNIKKQTDWIDPVTGQIIENPIAAKKKARFGSLDRFKK